ncbi:MAG: Phosphotransferase enzyme family, partial [Candidatus Parcubacteria bacterium]
MIDDQEKTKLLIQKFLGKEILSFELKGKGACNNAYYVETNDGKRYIIKEERSDKETDEQNDLAVEGKLIQNLSGLGLSIPLPKIVFVSKNPKIYGYEYIEGDMLSGLWKSLSEKEKICIFRSLGLFHAELGEKFTKKMSEASGIEINMSPGLHPEVVKEYERLVIDDKVPKKYRDLVQHAKEIFEGTFDKVVFQFIHNDAHHENVLIKDKKISGIIDFGNAEYGELAKEFSRYI